MTRDDDKRREMTSPLNRSAAERVSSPAPKPPDTLPGYAAAPPAVPNPSPGSRVETPSPTPAAKAPGSGVTKLKQKAVSLRIDELRELERLCRTIRDEWGMDNNLHFAIFARAYFKLLLDRRDNIAKVQKPIGLEVPSTQDEPALREFEEQLSRYLFRVLQGPNR